MTKFRDKGFSLVEVIMGMAILIFVLSAGMVALHTLTKASTSVTLRSKVDQKLSGVAESIRNEAKGDGFQIFDETPNLDRTCPSTPLPCTDLDRRIRVTSTISAIN